MFRYRVESGAWWLAAWLVLMAIVAGSLFYLRARVVLHLGSREAQAQWLEWKAETERQSQTPGPVARRPVHSPEPPALVLLRDHFGAVLGTSLLVAGVLFGFLALTVRGSMKGSSRLP